MSLASLWDEAYRQMAERDVAVFDKDARLWRFRLSAASFDAALEETRRFMAPNPMHDGAITLGGIYVVRDESLPPDTIILEPQP